MDTAETGVTSPNQDNPDEKRQSLSENNAKMWVNYSHSIIVNKDVSGNSDCGHMTMIIPF